MIHLLLKLRPGIAAGLQCDLRGGVDLPDRPECLIRREQLLLSLKREIPCHRTKQLPPILSAYPEQIDRLRHFAADRGKEPRTLCRSVGLDQSQRQSVLVIIIPDRNIQVPEPGLGVVHVDHGVIVLLRFTVFEPLSGHGTVEVDGFIIRKEVLLQLRGKRSHRCLLSGSVCSDTARNVLYGRDDDRRSPLSGICLYGQYRRNRSVLLRSCGRSNPQLIHLPQDTFPVICRYDRPALPVRLLFLLSRVASHIDHFLRIVRQAAVSVFHILGKLCRLDGKALSLCLGQSRKLRIGIGLPDGLIIIRHVQDLVLKDGEADLVSVRGPRDKKSGQRLLTVLHEAHGIKLTACQAPGIRKDLRKFLCRRGIGVLIRDDVGLFDAVLFKQFRHAPDHAVSRHQFKIADVLPPAGAVIDIVQFSHFRCSSRPLTA